MCTVTFSGGSPAASAAAAQAPLPLWVGTHTSQAPARTCAVQFMGSIGAWAR